MKKLISIGSATLGALLLAASCNSSSYETGEASTPSVAVYKFALSPDKNILANLDSVFFSIDLENKRIFNANPLPYGTETKKLVPVITIFDNVSVIELTSRKADGTDTTHNYLAHPNDSINFANGPVSMKVRSYDGLVECTYSITVNVSPVKMDSLVWDRAAQRPLPSSISAPTEQKTVACGERLVCLTRAASTYSIAHTDNPYNGTWETKTVAMPAGTIVNSLAATSDKLYVLAGNDGTNAELHTSSDLGQTWLPAGMSLHHIYGNCGDIVPANRTAADGTWQLVDAASGKEYTMPEGFPIENTSGLASYTLPLASGEQALMVGGTTANGSVSQAAWAFDGTNWANVASFPLKWAAKEMTLIPFVNFIVSSSWKVTTYPTMIAMGGLQTDGTINRTVYTSSDFGMSWQKAPELMQLPEEMAAVYGADALIANATLTENPETTSGRWYEIDLGHRIPGAAIAELPGLTPASRATKPITEWECPFIYLFGGHNIDGTTRNIIIRATFNRLLYKPIQ